MCRLDAICVADPMTPYEYTQNVINVLPGLCLCIALEAQVLQQWTGISNAAHPVFFCLIAGTTVFYLDKEGVLDK